MNDLSSSNNHDISILRSLHLNIPASSINWSMLNPGTDINSLSSAVARVWLKNYTTFMLLYCAAYLYRHFSQTTKGMQNIFDETLSWLFAKAEWYEWKKSRFSDTMFSSQCFFSNRFFVVCVIWVSERRHRERFRRESFPNWQKFLTVLCVELQRVVLVICISIWPMNGFDWL